MTEARSPLPPLDDIDGIFDLPEAVFPPGDPLRSLHEVLVARLRRELAEALAKPPTTIQLMVTERTAFNYILIKKTEQHPVGVKVKVGDEPEDGQPDLREKAVLGFAHMTAAKEFNAFWMNLAEQLNKMMNAGAAEYRQSMLETVAKTIREVLTEAVPDPVERAALGQRIGSALDSAVT